MHVRVPPHLAVSDVAYCPQDVFHIILTIIIFSLYGINRLVYLMESQSVHIELQNRTRRRVYIRKVDFSEMLHSAEYVSSYPRLKGS